MRIHPLLEKVGSYSGGLKVDRKSGTIYNVKILGFESENGRRYLPEAVKAAVSLYEGIKVNLDHPVGDASDPRSVVDRLGKLVNVRFVPGKGLFGDLKLLMSKPMSETICEAAEVMPDAFGLSHNAQGEGEEDKDGILVINKITEVRHVDLVADPATTKSLAESTAVKKVAVKLKEEGVLATMTKLAMKVRGAAQLLGEGVKIAMQGAQSDKRYAPFFGSVVKQLGTMQRNLLKDEMEFKKNAAHAKNAQGATEGKLTKKKLGLKSQGLKEAVVSQDSVNKADEIVDAVIALTRGFAMSLSSVDLSLIRLTREFGKSPDADAIKKQLAFLTAGWDKMFAAGELNKKLLVVAGTLRKAIRAEASKTQGATEGKKKLRLKEAEASEEQRIKLQKKAVKAKAPIVKRTPEHKTPAKHFALSLQHIIKG